MLQHAQPFRPFVSTIAVKGGVALTGALLAGFVFVHMAGNLQIYLGADVLNSYAASLKAAALVLWSARAFLLVVLLVHLAGIVTLWQRNTAARTVGYAAHDAMESTLASRTMVPSGLILLTFIVYHLLHFTVGVTHPEYFELHDPSGRPDVYSMVILSFRQPLVTLGYLAAMGLLGMHLAHGIASVLQTAGLRRPRVATVVDVGGRSVALVIVLGNVSIPLACLMGFLEPL